MNLQQKNTRFRAYQLGNAGSSFSYCDGAHFTLIEGRLTNTSKPHVLKELTLFNKSSIDTLHITSWDQDHCTPSELKMILDELCPKRVEFPSYEPYTDTGKNCLKLLMDYENNLRYKEPTVTLVKITPEYLATLKIAKNELEYTNVLIHPHEKYDNANDNSTVKLFRSGSFTVLSLGDVELPEISESLIKSDLLTAQVDVMILAHHGADNGFTTDKFLKAINPKLTVCSSNYDNQFEHPKQAIKDLLYQNGIKNFTTKTCYVNIKSVGQHIGEFLVVNFISNNEEVSSKYYYKSKRLDY